MNDHQTPFGVDPADPRAQSRLNELLLTGRLNRRELVRRGIALGLAVPSIAGLLAACGDDDDDDDATDEPTSAATTAATEPASGQGTTPTAESSGSPEAAGTATEPAAVATATQGTGAPDTGEKGGSGTLVVSIFSDPKSFNPDFQIDDAGYAAHSNIFNTMVVLDYDYNVIPELCSSWEVADDGLTITFTLTEGATWHDGEPVTSADCKYTIEQILATEGAPGAGNLSAVETVDTPDDATVIFNLSAPSAPLLGFLGWYGTFILPAHVYEGTDWTTNPANQEPVGSGPFKFVSYETGSTIELEANLEYWGGGPYLDELIFRIIPDANTALQAFMNGEVDFMLSPRPPLSQVASLQETPGLKVHTRPSPSVYYIGCNMQKEPVSILEVRTAISQAIDREQIVDTALGGYGEVATTFYTSAIAWAANNDPDAQVPQFDRAAAEATLDAAGFPADGGNRFNLVFPYFTASQEYADMATVVKQQLEEVGISVELVALEIGAWQERTQAGDYDISLLNGFQGPDPANLKLRVGTGGGVNFWFYSNPEIDALLEEGAQLSDQDERAEKYHAVQALLAKDLPIIPLSGVVTIYPYADSVTGMFFEEALGQTGLNRFNLVKIEG